MNDFPDWMMPFRLAAPFLIWGMFPVLVWLTWTNSRQWRIWRQWEADEAVRRERWRENMEAASKQLEEAGHLRVQAEIALAQARRQMLNTQSDDDWIVKE